MAERESLEYDLRAIRRGLQSGLLVGGAVTGFLLVVWTTCAPVLRELGGSGAVPHIAAVWLVGGAVGAVVAGARMSAGRRVRAGASGSKPGTRALELARHEYVRRSRPEVGPGKRAAVVQRWSSDLLAGGDRLPVEAVSDE